MAKIKRCKYKKKRKNTKVILCNFGEKWQNSEGPNIKKQTNNGQKSDCVILVKIGEKKGNRTKISLRKFGERWRTPACLGMRTK